MSAIQEQLPDLLPSGYTLLDRYRIVGLLRKGGMSVVYDAVDETNGRVLAVKVLPGQLRTRVLHQRFLREARLAAQVVHANVVSTIDAGVLCDETPFIVMERLEGETVRDLLLKEGRLPLAQSVHILRQVLAGIEAAHARGVIHRDLKPSNVLRLDGARDGFVKVIDFGLSKDIATHQKSLTGPGETLGTPSYMAPEQVLAERVDARTDVYGAGVLFYEMVTGQRAVPYNDAVQSVFEAILTHPVPAPSSIVPELSSALDEFVAKALAKYPAGRFSSARSMARAAQAL